MILFISSMILAKIFYVFAWKAVTLEQCQEIKLFIYLEILHL